eukprot:gnl/MRDRNA2_/MRDRNA2_148211_c0_seq1.p1 gnl/MRDRNA2_/MRDRNA2_148211_c0~~gnl/MRDRNA2_/MRDRNA2_148211_c0_seq1.p1  ORF type:complete len:220 (+),score=42.63 gnl/MRDRNA2_/MRDRNA2_148211_c0_seq1:85-744(+)
MSSKLTSFERTTITYPVQNTFIQYPTLRSPSLEEYLKEREAQSCPISPRQPLFLEGESPPLPPGQPPLLPGHGDDDVELAEAINLNNAKEDAQYQCESESSDDSSEDLLEDVEQKMQVISLSTGLGIQSKGLKSHETGSCKPCAFFWKDGCKNGPACHYCHLCPPGELKRRKKARAMMLRRQSRYNMPSRTSRFGANGAAREGVRDSYYRRPAGAFGGA